MSPKYFESLNSAFLAHFSRRLSDLITAQGTEILREMQMTTPSTAISTMIFIHKNNDVTAAVLADAFGVSHQMATQRVNALEKLGLLERISQVEDRRSKNIALTASGKAEVKQLEPFIKKMKLVFDEIDTETGVELMSIIRRAELALLENPLKARLKQMGR
jgi:DNA-binding MarR family transcriptional regulator